ncbi:MAG: hypothetical protein LUQ34_03760 [Euryarchaeota archaeon]|jgi:hypothetical protein|nr:hypothetical protein [Euryarchaeota archaeon]
MPTNAEEQNSAYDLEDQVLSELRMIEVSHDITLKNLASIAKIIIANVKNNTQALQVCTAINTWIAINGMQGNVTVPEPLVKKYVRRTIS